MQPVTSEGDITSEVSLSNLATQMRMCELQELPRRTAVESSWSRLGSGPDWNGIQLCSSSWDQLSKHSNQLAQYMGWSFGVEYPQIE